MLETKTALINQLANSIKVNFVQIGKILTEIQDQKLYLDKYPSFTQYMESNEFQFSRRHGYRFMQAYQIVGGTECHNIPLNKIFALGHIPDEKIRQDLTPQPKAIDLNKESKQIHRFSQRIDLDLETKEDSAKDKLLRQINVILEQINIYESIKADLDNSIKIAFNSGIKYASDEKIQSNLNLIKERWIK